MRRRFLIALAMGALALLPIRAYAVPILLNATIDGTQTVPGTGSPGTGAGAMSFETTTNLLSWSITWSGLLAPEVAAHFHGPAPPGVNAGVQVNFGGISGFTSPSVGATLITAPQAADLLAGLWYINIHTSLFPGGEIRGQVVRQTVPEPSTLALFAIALAGLGFMTRRRRGA